MILIFRFCLIILFIQFSVEQKCHWNLIGNCSAQFCVCCCSCCLLHKEGKGGKCTEFNSKVLKLFYKNGFHFLDNKIHVPKGISKEQFFFFKFSFAIGIIFYVFNPNLSPRKEGKNTIFHCRRRKKEKVPISLQHNKKQKHLLLTHKRQEER